MLLSSIKLDESCSCSIIGRTVIGGGAAEIGPEMPDNQATMWRRSYGQLYGFVASMPANVELAIRLVGCYY